MSSTFNRLAYGRIDTIKLLATYAVGIGAGALLAVALLALVGAPTP
jgi:hypothetical protein